jgi:hypothetical protein
MEPYLTTRSPIQNLLPGTPGEVLTRTAITRWSSVPKWRVQHRLENGKIGCWVTVNTEPTEAGLTRPTER